MARIKCALLAIIFVSSVVTVSGFVTMETHHDQLPVRTQQAWYTVEINATVVDDFGRNISGATIHIRDNASTWQTNDSGFWVIRGLADDVPDYTLYAEKQFYLNAPDVVLPVTGNQSYNVTLTIIGGTILGTVTSLSAPIEGANVSISALGYSTDVSPADGTYALSGIPGGTHSVTAGAPGYVSQTKDATIVIGGAAQVNFQLVPQNGSIAGFVFNAMTLVPLNNSIVSVNLTDKTVTVTTGDDGSYVITDLPEGTYVVLTSKEGFYPVTKAGILVTKGNRTEDVNFTLTEKPTMLYGTVKSGALLLRLVNISVVGTGFFNISDAAGNYRIENVTAGRYNVTAARDGYVTTVIADVAIPVGGVVELDIELIALPGAVLIGTVVDRGDPEKTLYNVAVTIFISGTQQRTELTDPFGQFGFTELAAGNYTLQFEVSGYRPMEVRNVAVKENGTTNVTFYMEPLRKGFEGFIFGFDLAHSMMILALFITIMILAVAVYLRYRTFQTPESAPAVYDQEEEPAEKKEDTGTGEPGKDEGERDEI
jgi:hypothetical protein